MHHRVKEIKTLEDILHWGEAEFIQAGVYLGHGTDNAWDEAVALTCYALQLSGDCQDDILQSVLSTNERDTILQLFKSRIETRKPAAYLTQRAYFAGLEFYIDERAIIPRSPLAEVIENQCQPWIATNKVRRILDLCTGGGCMAIAAAHYFPEAQIDAVDISPEALEVAKINLAKHHCQDRVRLLESDLFQSVAGCSYDIIITNPPYVSHDEMASLPREYSHEPLLALRAEADGLAIVSRILEESKQYLNPHGILLVEVGNTQDVVIEHYPELPLVWLAFERGGFGVFLLTAEDLA